MKQVKIKVKHSLFDIESIWLDFDSKAQNIIEMISENRLDILKLPIGGNSYSLIHNNILNNSILTIEFSE